MLTAARKVWRCCCRGRFSTRILRKHFCCLPAVYVFGCVACFSAACLYIWLFHLCLRCVCIFLVLQCLFWSAFLRGNCQTNRSFFVYAEVFTSHKNISHIHTYILMEAGQNFVFCDLAKYSLRTAQKAMTITTTLIMMRMMMIIIIIIKVYNAKTLWKIIKINNQISQDIKILIGA